VFYLLNLILTPNAEWIFSAENGFEEWGGGCGDHVEFRGGSNQSLLIHSKGTEANESVLTLEQNNSKIMTYLLAFLVATLI